MKCQIIRELSKDVELTIFQKEKPFLFFKLSSITINLTEHPSEQAVPIPLTFFSETVNIFFL